MLAFFGGQSLVATRVARPGKLRRATGVADAAGIRAHAYRAVVHDARRGVHYSLRRLHEVSST
jgi:hypothetical protein